MKKALLIIDIQNDFLQGGPLPVRAGNEVIDVANGLIKMKGAWFDYVVASQDAHPTGHKSFASQHPGKKPGDVIRLNGVPQILWPDHCVQGTLGGEFAKSLNIDQIDVVFKKGLDIQIDSYSAFFDNTTVDRWGNESTDTTSGDTGLNDWLASKSVSCLIVLGLATDYCVLFSVIDALKLGYDVTVVTDGCRGVDIERDDSARALARMQALGARLITSFDLARENS